MFNKKNNKEDINKETDSSKEEVIDSSTREATLENRGDEKELEADATREVLVTSQTISSSKVVVIFNKVRPPVGPLRDQFNIYQFSDEGTCKMLERDAILFWKQIIVMKDRKEDISVTSLDGEIEYNFDEVKDLYEVGEVPLADSGQ